MKKFLSTLLMFCMLLLWTSTARAQYSLQPTDMVFNLQRPSTTLPGQYTPIGNFTLAQLVSGAGVSNYVLPTASTSVLGGVIVDGTTITINSNGVISASATGSGNVNGPASSTSTAVALFSGTTGKLLQNSAVTIDSSGDIVTTGNLTVGTLIPTSITWGTTVVPAANGGTGISTSSSTGVPTLISGTWSVSTSPALGTPTATTLNGNTFTAGTYTLTGAAGKTLTFNNSLTLAGTDATTMTFPGASDTVAGLATVQTFTGADTFNPTNTASSGTPIGTELSAVINQTSTAGFTVADINSTNTAFGSGTQYLLNVRGATNSVFNVGNLTFGAPVAATGFQANFPSQTFTATGTTGVASMGAVHIGTPTLTNASANTITTLATLLIDNAPSVAGSQVGTNKYALYVTAGNVFFGANLTVGNLATFSSAFTSNGATSTITGSSSSTALAITQTARTSGVLPYIKITIPADTGQTAATESPGIQGVTGTRTWATTGTIALQREIFWPGPTYASASASQTFTDVFNTYWTPPVQGSNAIFTREHTLGVVDATSSTSAITGGVVISTTLGTAATSIGMGGGNITVGGNLFASTSTGRIGYLVGSGVGTAVTQTSSRTTAVTSNTPTGAITLFAAAGTTTPATFTVNCTSIAVGDTVVISEASGTNQYIATCSAISAGISFNITFYAEVGTTSDSPVLNYTIIKGSST